VRRGLHPGRAPALPDVELSKQLEELALRRCDARGEAAEPVLEVVQRESGEAISTIATTLATSRATVYRVTA